MAGVTVAPEATTEVLVELALARLGRLHRHVDDVSFLEVDDDRGLTRFAAFIAPLLEEVVNLLAAATEPQRGRRGQCAPSGHSGAAR